MEGSIIAEWGLDHVAVCMSLRWTKTCSLLSNTTHRGSLSHMHFQRSNGGLVTEDVWKATAIWVTKLALSLVRQPLDIKLPRGYRNISLCYYDNICIHNSAIHKTWQALSPQKCISEEESSTLVSVKKWMAFDDAIRKRGGEIPC